MKKLVKTVRQGRTAKKPEALMNTGNTRTTKTFRFLQSDIKKLNRISTLKKATQTRVITELIRLAYAGLFIPEMQELDKFYKTIIEEKLKRTQDKLHLKRKRKVLK